MIRIPIRVKNDEFVIPLSVTGSVCLFSTFGWANISLKLQEAENAVKMSQFMQEAAPYAEIYEFTEQYYQYKDQALIWQNVAILCAVLFVVLFIADRYIYYKRMKEFLEK